MPMPAACIEQAFAQESGELFVEETRAMRLVIASRGHDDRAAAEGSVEGADRHHGEPPRAPAVFATGQAVLATGQAA